MATSKPLYRPDMNTEIASSDVLFHVDIAATANQPEPDLFNALSRLLQETSIIEVAYSFQEQVFDTHFFPCSTLFLLESLSSSFFHARFARPPMPCIILHTITDGVPSNAVYHVGIGYRTFSPTIRKSQPFSLAHVGKYLCLLLLCHRYSRPHPARPGRDQTPTGGKDGGVL